MTERQYSWRRRWTMWPSVSALLLLSVSCSGSGADGVADVSVTVPRGPGGTVQAAILEDGIVEESEYEQAMLAAAQCIEDGGGAYQQFGWVERPDYRTIQFVANDPELLDSCFHQFARAVQTAWVLQHVPSEAEWQARLAQLGKCLESQGIEYGDWRTFWSVTMPKLEDAQVRQYIDCAEQAGVQ